MSLLTNLPILGMSGRLGVGTNIVVVMKKPIPEAKSTQFLSRGPILSDDMSGALNFIKSIYCKIPEAKSR